LVFCQAVRSLRFAGAGEAQREWPPEKSLSRYSWMSRAVEIRKTYFDSITGVDWRNLPVLFNGSFRWTNASADEGEYPVQLWVKECPPDHEFPGAIILCNCYLPDVSNTCLTTYNCFAPEARIPSMAAWLLARTRFYLLSNNSPHS
jgi:hypothetical protein